jgi:7,8-dihydropterin-6-yl-methyl-4-(beta-D-ribofuranosyl)aminobenzene 5'-phosphate synthase
MNMTFKITSLVENTRAQEHLCCEPGLSLLIEWQGKNFLMDAGASDAFLDNADALGKDLTKVDYVILSHGHSDHSGGLRTLCRSTRRKFSLVLSPHFFDKKFIRDGEYLRYIGNDFAEEFLQIENVATIFPMINTFSLIDGVYILSDIQRTAAVEEEANGFVVLRGGEYTEDRFADEQVLVFELPQGLAVVTGCGHSGIINICETVKKRLQKPIYAIIGGLHLKSSSNERIEQTAAYLREQGVVKLALGHCTGEKSMTCLEAAGTEIYSLASGTILEFD